MARVLDFEADDEAPFVVTELIEGPTLAQVVQEYPLSLDECHFLAEQLMDLLQRIHHCGIAHRDLKPSNIIIAPDGPVLIDFGIAQSHQDERLTQTGKLTGTPGYVSPEILSSADDGDFSRWQRGDWWAWSALLLSSLTGRPPFGSGNQQMVLQNVLRGQPDTAGLDPALAAVFTGALSGDPNTRLQPAELLRALDRAVNYKGVPETVAAISPPDLTLVQGTPTATPQPLLPAAPTPAAALPHAAPPHVAPPAPQPAAPQASSASTPFPLGFAHPAAPLPEPPSPTAPRHPTSTLVFIAVLALLPVWWGGLGLLVSVGISAAISVFGQGHYWRDERRRVRGSSGRRDNVVATLAAPRHLIVGILQMIPGALLATLVGILAWFLMTALGGGGTELWWPQLQEWLLHPQDIATRGLVIWFLSWLTITVLYISPTSTGLRRGTSLLVGWVLPKRGIRSAVNAGILAVCAILALLANS